MSAVQHTHEGQAVATSSAKSEAPAEVKNNAEIPANAETGNVDKIREILFGGQMRDYDKRFSRLEERLLKESNELREGNRRSLEALETFVKNEFASLANRLQMEQQSREGSDQNLSRELQESIRSVEGKLTQFQNQTTEAQRDLRQQLLDQSKSLNEEIRRKHDELSTTIEREVADLSHEKTDRSSLSALFTELALRLNNDFKIPGEN
jgi:exonuclease VII large subunit